MQEEKNTVDDIQFKKRVFTCVFGACIVVAFYLCLTNWEKVSCAIGNFVTIFQPFIIGFVLSFLMNPIMQFFEKYLLLLFKKIKVKEEKSKNSARTISAILSLIVLIGFVGLFIGIVIPQLKETIFYLSENIPNQIDNILDWCNTVTQNRFEQNIENIKNSRFDEVLDYTVDLSRKYLDYDNNQVLSLVTTSVIGFVKVLVNIIIGFFVSIYALLGKEKFKGQIKKILFGIFKAKHANIILEVSRKSGQIFYGFIIGKIIDSIIIGILCYIGCLIMKMPYAVLVSVIVGVTNVVPVFGPYIGAIPTVLIIFLTSPIQGLYFLIFVLVLQQFDGNVLGPKILGNSTGITSFWVVFGVVVGAGFLGVPGMIIGVPLTAIVYYVMQRFAKFLLRKKELPVETSEYVMLKRVNEETMTIEYLSKEDVSSKNFSFKFDMSFLKKKKKK